MNSVAVIGNVNVEIMVKKVMPSHEATCNIPSCLELSSEMVSLIIITPPSF
jgi:hypothetical protein